METVEKPLYLMACLALRLWIHCGRMTPVFLTFVEKKPIPLYIRFSPARFLPFTLHMVHIFLPKPA